MIFNFRRYTKIRRPTDVLKEQTIFDVLSCELQSMAVMRTDNAMKLTYHDKYKKVKLYDILFQSSGDYLYSIYRTLDRQDAETKFELIAKILNAIQRDLCPNSRNCNLTAQTLTNAVHSILKNQAWKPIHFAARFGLSSFFRPLNNENHIEEHLNAKSCPLQRTPIMLAILSNDLETIKTILNLNPQISHHDKRGNNVLHFAAICSTKIWSAVFKYCSLKDDSKKLLVRRNNKFATPMHFICYSKNFENMVDLLRFGLPVETLTIEPPHIIKRQVRHEELIQQIKRKTIDDAKDGSKDVLTKMDENSSHDSLEAEDKRTIVHFTNEMISDLKLEDMIYGGTPLHWCQFKRTLERLIEYEFNVDAFDLNNETALTKCIKDNRFKCMVILLNAGADPNLVNKKGNTNLHTAVLGQDIAAVQACICWDAKLDEKNKTGETARHLASVRGTTDDQMIVHILHSVGAKRCDKKMTNCRPDCAYNGLTNGKKYSKWPNFERESPYFPFMNQKIIENKLKDLAVESSQKDNGETKESKKVRMICFDGGGTKGLISVQMLIEIEKRLKRPLNDYFEWMSGTSTGSLITAMLSLNIPLRNIKVIYYMLRDKIMIGPRPYDSGRLECILQGVLGENVKMGEIEKKIIITGTLADRTPCQLYLFRSYPSPSEILNLKQSVIEKLLFTKKEEIFARNLNKMKNAKPHGVIIELSTLLSNYQNQTTVNAKKSMSHNDSIDCNIPPEPVIKPVVRSSLSTASKTASTVFSLCSNTTLSEFTETPDIRVHDDHSLSSMRLKFYHIPNYLSQKLWLACRSSGAAPTFFRASGPFIDGGIISNNPLLDSLTDFINYNCALKQRGFTNRTKELDLVLSIGTGKSPVVPTEVIDIGKLYSLNFLEPYQSAVQAFNLAQEMVTMATQTDAHVVQRGQAWCNSMQVAYFRFNPPLSESLLLNEVEEVEIVNALWETKAYMYNQRSIIEILVKLLEKPSVIST